MKIAKAGFRRALKAPDKRTAIRQALSEHDTEQAQGVFNVLESSDEESSFICGPTAWASTRFTPSRIDHLGRGKPELHIVPDDTFCDDRPYITAKDADLDTRFKEEPSWDDSDAWPFRGTAMHHR